MVSGSARSRSILFFSVVTTLYWSSMYIYVPTLSVHAENLGASVALVGMIVASYGFPQILVRIPMGIWSDRIGVRKPFILAGIAISTLAGLGLALTSDPALLVVWRAMSGVGAPAFPMETRCWREIASRRRFLTWSRLWR
ncbi:MAG TPA: MFS transporter [Chloroflexota bacterium]|nr:MFS transporter [Chloroflexota bacterium]